MTPLLYALADVGVVAGCGLMAVVPGSWLVTWVFRRVDREDVARTLRGSEPTDRPPAATPEAAATDGAAVVPAAASPADRDGGPADTLQGAGAVLRGGRWIGRLERLAVYASITAGYPNGLAVSVAVKALARYPELRSTTSAAAERFIIGTFVSVLWACAWAGLTRWVLGLY